MPISSPKNLKYNYYKDLYEIKCVENEKLIRHIQRLHTLIEQIKVIHTGK